MYISQRKSKFLKTIRSPYILNTPGRSSKLTPTGVEIDTCASQMGCQLSSAASGMSLGLCYWHNFSGMKRSCRTTGSWWYCLSLGIVSSIPVGSTIIYRFLYGFICVSLCQSIKIKPTKMYIASDRAQFKINTHGCWNWHLCIPGGLSVVQCSLEHVIEIVFLTFPCARASTLNQLKCISPALGRSLRLTHTGVELDTCALQMGCQLPSAASGM